MVTGEKYCPLAVIPATVTIARGGSHGVICCTQVYPPVSVYTGPETDVPSPYFIEKDPDCFCMVAESDAVYLFLAEQVGSVHDDDGTQISEEPASRSYYHQKRTH